jgi:hypothetical protein
VGVVDVIATTAEIITIASCLLGGEWLVRQRRFGAVAISGRA